MNSPVFKMRYTDCRRARGFAKYRWGLSKLWMLKQNAVFNSERVICWF